MRTSDLLTAADGVGQTTAVGSTITLYPVWELAIPDDGNLGTMQNFICNNLGSGHTATLTDARDNQTYTVYRIPTDQTYKDTTTIANVAGKCLMTKDLSLGYATGGSITEDSDLVLSADTSAGPTTSSAPIKFVDAANGGSGWSTTNSDSNLQYTNGPRSGYEEYSSQSYYSYGAAQKVCPKGWRLPTRLEFSNVEGTSTPTSGIAAIVGNNASGSIAVRSAPWSFHLGGRFLSSGWVDQGTLGLYWTSSQTSNSDGYLFYLSKSSVMYSWGGGKNPGRPVRCIADAYDEGDTMQSTSASALAEGKTTVLTDARDEQKYTVYRWPSSGTAGTDYPTGMSGYAIMTQDLALGYVTGGSITKDTNLVTTTDTSVGAGTIIYANSANNGSGWAASNNSSSLYYTNGPKVGSEASSSHSYYTFGAANIVCPKGWNLPSKTQYESIGSFMKEPSVISGSPYYFNYGAGFTSAGWKLVDDRGQYWTSTQYSGVYAWFFQFVLNDSSFTVEHGAGKAHGMAVRCIAAP